MLVSLYWFCCVGCSGCDALIVCDGLVLLGWLCLTGCVVLYCIMLGCADCAGLVVLGWLEWNGNPKPSQGVSQ